MDILFNPWDLGVFALSSPNDVSFYYMKDGKDAYNFEKPELFYSIASDVKVGNQSGIFLSTLIMQCKAHISIRQYTYTKFCSIFLIPYPFV